jgi:hypothetical protein
MGAPRLTRPRVLVASAVLLTAFLAAVSFTGLLMLSPAIALLVLLGFGLFPSDELIARVRRRLSRARRIAPLPVARPKAPAVARAGAVLAFALAVRPPPARRSLISA